MLSSRRILPTLIATVALGLAASTSEAATVLLVGNAGTNSILEFDATTGAPVGSGTFAKDPSLQTPFGMFVDSTNNYLYVCSLGTGSIDRFNLQTGAPAPATGQTGATFISNIAYPNNVLIVNNTLYATSFTSNSVMQYSIGTTGNHDPGTGSVFINVSSTAAGGANPTGMVYDYNTTGTSNTGTNNQTSHANNFYVAVSNPGDPDKILQYNNAGTLLQNFNHNGTPGTTLVAPAGMVIQAPPGPGTGTTGILWASSFDNAASNTAVASHIAGYTYNGNPGSDGKIALNINSSGSVVLNQPAGLALDSTNTHLFVANSGNNNILEFNTATGAPTNGGNGVFIAAGTNGLNLPLYMAIATITSPPGILSFNGGLSAGSVGGFAVEAPEPTSFALLGMGVMGLVGYAWRRRALKARASA